MQTSETSSIPSLIAQAIAEHESRAVVQGIAMLVFLLGFNVVLVLVMSRMGII